MIDDSEKTSSTCCIKLVAKSLSMFCLTIATCLDLIGIELDELMVKISSSIGYYVISQGMPFRFV